MIPGQAWHEIQSPTEEGIYQLDVLNIKNLCLKGYHPENEEIIHWWDICFINYTIVEKSISLIYKELLQLNNKINRNPHSVLVGT